MRSRISIRGYVRRSVRPSVRPSVGPSVRPSHTSWISEKWADFEQNSVRNMRLCHLKDNSETSTLADRQNASVVWTLFNLFVVRFAWFALFAWFSYIQWSLRLVLRKRKAPWSTSRRMLPEIFLALEICPSCFCDWTFNLIQGLQIGKNNVLFILIVNGCYALASWNSYYE